MSAEIGNLLTFLHEAEGVKKLLRHSWLSDGRQESVAEHSWRMGLMVMVIAPQLGLPINTERALKIASIHDLPEVFGEDHYAFNPTPEGRQEQERQGLTKIIRNLPEVRRDEIIELWEEFEAGETPEARLVRAIDKIEVLIQHNEADLSTWNEKERDKRFNLVYGDEHCQYDQFLCLLKDAVRVKTVAKLEQNP